MSAVNTLRMMMAGVQDDTSAGNLEITRSPFVRLFQRGHGTVGEMLEKFLTNLPERPAK